MNLADWILNLAALFLWIDWRTGSAAKLTPPPISLASAIRETNRQRARGWGSLAGAAAILLVRPFFYYTVGSAVEWTPVLDLDALSLPFRSDMLDRMFAFSSVSFALTLGYYYGGLLFIGAIRSTVPEAEVMRRFVRAQLGWLARWPAAVKIVLPFAMAAAAWAALAPVLEGLGITPGTRGAATIWAQGGILALSSVLAWQWIFVGLFLLDGLNSYIYFGAHPFWVYLAEICGVLLRPLWFLRFGKLDLAPFAAAALLLAVSELAIRPAVARLFERLAA